MLVYVIKSYILLSFDCIIMEKDIQMGLRLKPEFHEECSKVAKEKGQSLAEWIRRAIQKELDCLHEQRDAGSVDAVTATLLEALNDPKIRAVIKEKLKD